MQMWVAELIGTAILIYLGTSVVANTILDGTKGGGGGIMVIATGWALAVMVPAIMFGEISGAVFNPALTLALAMVGALAWADVTAFIIAQFVGAFIGAVIAWVQYKDHFDITQDPGAKLGCFATGPAIKNTPLNFLSEMLATFTLVILLLGIGHQPFADGTNFFAVGGIIMVIGVALGGTTGYAINPARDLAPRIAFAILPIKNKPAPDWGYAWIPVVAPVVGALLAGGLYLLVW